MRFGLLGPTTVWTDDGDVVPVTGAKVRALLTHMLLHVGTPITADRLIEDLWDEPTRRNPAGALSAKVSQLRRALDEAEPGARALVVSPPPGYVLAVDPGAVDAVEFERLVTQAQDASDPKQRVELLDRALGLWRGPVCAEFADAEFTRTTVVRLDDLRLTAQETLARARIDLGEHAQVVAGLTELVRANPWRERLRLAHVLALYRCGRQQEALASVDTYRRHLADELGLDPGPEIVEMQGAILAQDPAIAAPVRHRSRPATNLPAAVTPLVGRDDAIAELVQTVPTSRLTTLTGPGGVGKTSLALEVGRRLRTTSHGVWLVELAAIERSSSRDSPAALAEFVLTTLGIRQAGDRPVDQLAETLADSGTLLVLDNCEQVVASVATLVDRLLRDTSDVTVLATSREPLGLTGETVWTVPALAVPDPRDQGDPESVRRSAAVRLFVARARAADRTFDLNSWNAPMIGALCRRLDGIPLALELAATRVATLGVRELLARLGDRFRLLSSTRRDAPARHQTLAAVIEWSWELLTPVERSVLRRLSVHVDGCALDAAEATCAGTDVPVDDVLDVVQRLVERSLVVAVGGRGGMRYRLLESVAEYAAHRSVDASEVATQRARHRAYYTDLVTRATPLLLTSEQQHWYARLDDEAANIRAAIESAVDDGAADDAVRIVAGMGWFWCVRGRFSEARRLIGVALAVPGATPGVALAESLTWRAMFCALLGDTADLARLRDEALAMFGDEPAGARAMSHLGLVTFDAGDMATGEYLLNAGRERSAAQGDAWGEALACVSLAKLAQSRGELAELEHLATRSDALFEQVGDRWGKGVAADWLCALAEMTGDLERAREINEAGLRDAEELGLWPAVADRLSWLGWLAVQRGDLADAVRFGTDAHALATEQGSMLQVVFSTMVLGVAARRAGDAAGATRHLGRLRDMADAAEEPPVYLPIVLTELGFLAEQHGDATTALALHVEALEVAVARGYPRDSATAIEGAAAALAMLGDLKEAARLLGAAREHRRVTKLPAAATECVDIERARRRCADALGDDFATAIDAGAALTPGEALAILHNGRY